MSQSATVSSPRWSNLRSGGSVVLSTRRARSRQPWTRMTELEKTGEVLEAEVVEANRGGLVVDLGLRGFVPFSQLAAVGNLVTNERGAVTNEFRTYVGKRLPLKSSWRIRVATDPSSRRRPRRNNRRRRKEEASFQLMEGQVDGTVASITTFGLFVDVRAADGLVHRSEITCHNGIEPTTLHRLGDRCVCSSRLSTGSGVVSPYPSNGWRRIPGRAPRVSLPSGPISRPR